MKEESSSYSTIGQRRKFSLAIYRLPVFSRLIWIRLRDLTPGDLFKPADYRHVDEVDRLCGTWDWMNTANLHHASCLPFYDPIVSLTASYTGTCGITHQKCYQVPSEKAPRPLFSAIQCDS